MRRQGQYGGDSGVNSYISQMQQASAAQRMHHGSGVNHFSGRSDALPSEEGNQYVSSKAEGQQWQWDRNEVKATNPVSSQHYNEGEGGDATRSYYPGGQRPEPKQAIRDSKPLSLEEDMEIGYEDINSPPRTFEGLTQKFHDEIMKLTKEQQDAEDTENTRHRERLVEINAKYQEKLTALRVNHANKRNDFLQKELQNRQNEYQTKVLSPSYHDTKGTSEPPHGYGGSAAAAAGGGGGAGQYDSYRERAHDTKGTSEPPHSYGGSAAAGGGSGGAGQYDSYRERAQYVEGGRSYGYESRGPYPGGRAYNNTNARYY